MPHEVCLFCKVVSGEMPSCKIYEDDEFLAVLDRFPSSAGHTLIIPKQHVENIFEIDSEQAGRLFQLATKISKGLREVFQTEAMNLLQNNGKEAGQTVFHFHLHLIPRYENDQVQLKWEATQPSLEELQKVAGEIQKIL